MSIEQITIVRDDDDGGGWSLRIGATTIAWHKRLDQAANALEAIEAYGRERASIAREVARRETVEACARVCDAHNAHHRADSDRRFAGKPKPPPGSHDYDFGLHHEGAAAGCAIDARDIRAMLTGGSGCVVCAAAKVGAT
jgi:hypothetical protein